MVRAVCITDNAVNLEQLSAADAVALLVFSAGMVTAKCQFEDFEGAFAGLSYFLDNIDDKKNLVVVSPDAGGMKRA